MSNFNLNSVAMLCEFTSSVWTARILDRKESGKVVSGAGAKSKDAARVNKNLLAGRSELAEIGQLVGEARTYVYENTLPWSDNGQRLLIGSRFVAFDAKMEEYKALFKAKVEAFVALYPTLITAQAMSLGDMFNRGEFPLASEIAHKFALACDYAPVPSAGDLRVDVGNQAQNELRAKMQAMADKRVTQAMSDVSERFVAHLSRMADRLVTDTDPKTGEPTNRRFTETLVSSAFELCGLIGDYNVTRDPKLDDARKTLEAALSGVTTDVLRTDVGKREDVRKAVTGILGKFNI
jgi:hypothetical protein